MPGLFMTVYNHCRLHPIYSLMFTSYCDAGGVLTANPLHTSQVSRMDNSFVHETYQPGEWRINWITDEIFFKVSYDWIHCSSHAQKKAPLAPRILFPCISFFFNCSFLYLFSSLWKENLSNMYCYCKLLPDWAVSQQSFVRFRQWSANSTVQ